jgi:hypothetical protein
MPELENWEKAITTAKKTKTDIGVDGTGSIDSVLGFTASVAIERDDNGDIIFDSPQEIDPSDKSCHAKIVLIKQDSDSYYTKRYVKMGLDGLLFNPWGMYSEGTEDKYVTRYGKPQWSFAEVTEKCFINYVKFLQSRNRAWLNNAEREVR